MSLNGEWAQGVEPPGFDQPVLLDIEDGGIATITLNRPETANAMDLALVTALREVVLRCHVDSAVRVVVLKGVGRNFCTGGDMKDFLAHADRLPSHVKEISTWLQSVTAALVSLDVPVVAAVQGYAAGGGGLGLVAGCDFVVAAESAKFMSGAVRVGMIPDAGLTVILTQLVGLRKAMEITLLNPTLDSAEALALGLVTKVVPDHALTDQTRLLAETLAGLAPQAAAECKRLLWNGIGTSVAAGLGEEARAVVRLAGADDCLEGLLAATQRRRANFGGS